MSRESEPVIIESVFYHYTGTDEQFDTFLKSVIKDYVSENNLLPDDENIIDEKSA